MIENISFEIRHKKGRKVNSLPFYCLSANYLSSNAATPGRTFPSINSKEAPPPVET